MYTVSWLKTAFLVCWVVSWWVIRWLGSLINWKYNQISPLLGYFGGRADLAIEKISFMTLGNAKDIYNQNEMDRSILTNSPAEFRFNPM